MHAVYLLRPSCLAMMVRFMVFIELVLDTILGKTKITRTDVGGLKEYARKGWFLLIAVGRSSLIYRSANNKQIASGLLRIPRKARNNGSIHGFYMVGSRYNFGKDRNHSN